MRNRALARTEVCGVPGCGKTKAEHADKAHAYSVEGDLQFNESKRPGAPERGNTQRSKGPTSAGVLGDPVLRFILVQKGIVTTDELDEAEKVLRATGMLKTS